MKQLLIRLAAGLAAGLVVESPCIYGLLGFALKKTKMENKVFFLKYQENQPVKIESHFIGENNRRRPLSDVGDLVAAFQARPGSLLANTDSGLITLHSSSVNGIETSYNSWDQMKQMRFVKMEHCRRLWIPKFF